MTAAIFETDVSHDAILCYVFRHLRMIARAFTEMQMAAPTVKMSTNKTVVVLE